MFSPVCSPGRDVLHSKETLIKTLRLLDFKACRLLAPCSVFLLMEDLKNMVLALKATLKCVSRHALLCYKIVQHVLQNPAIQKQDIQTAPVPLWNPEVRREQHRHAVVGPSLLKS